MAKPNMQVVENEPKPPVIIDPVKDQLEAPEKKTRKPRKKTDYEYLSDKDRVTISQALTIMRASYEAKVKRLEDAGVQEVAEDYRTQATSITELQAKLTEASAIRLRMGDEEEAE